MESTVHIGRKIGRIRELRGMKQDTLARELGISQQAVSKIEQSKAIREEVLQKIAGILAVTTEDIKHFSEEALFNNMSDSLQRNKPAEHNSQRFNEVFNNINHFYDQAIQNNFNPVEQIVSFYDKKTTLLEQTLRGMKKD